MTTSPTSHSTFTIRFVVKVSVFFHFNVWKSAKLNIKRVSTTFIMTIRLHVFQSVKMDIKPVCKKTIIKPDKTTSPEAIIILPEKNGLNVFQETGVSCFFCHINNKIMYASAPSQKAIAIWWNTRGASATNG